MWLVFTCIYALTMAIVNYIDEYLTLVNSVSEDQNIHKRIGGVLLASTLLGVFSVAIIWLLVSDFSMSQRGLYISIFSGIPMVITFASYFYLFQKFPANQVVPLFGLSSIWLLILELMIGGSISLIPFIGILILIAWAYLLDTWSISWKIPTQLFVFMLPLTLLWAINHFLVKIVSFSDSVITMFFYQWCMIVFIGILIFLFLPRYREGFLNRIRSQWKIFIGVSMFAEWVAQVSFFTWAIAVSLATLATYVSAVSGIQYIILFVLLYLFPLHERNKITVIEVFSMLLIVLGVFLIELFK